MSCIEETGLTNAEFARAWLAMEREELMGKLAIAVGALQDIARMPADLAEVAAADAAKAALLEIGEKP